GGGLCPPNPGPGFSPAVRRLNDGRNTGSHRFTLLARSLMAMKVFLSGELVDASEAKISVFDHGLLYGDGVFEGIRVYDGRIFRHRQHIDRLYESAKAIRLAIPMSPAEMLATVEATVRANKIEDGYVRLVVTRGRGSLGLDIRTTRNPQVIIIADTI